ncbi:MAG: nucleotidyltransferase domain-containing protein [Deltaproteobacteria bacterium]|nr:nucleotidyltransferase domain-containing protein [Deltaproteobacteria bacterium]
MDKAEVIAKVKQFSDLVNREMRIKKVVLFGSHAKGCAGEESDIDVAVIVESLEDDFLDVESRLFKLRRSVDVRIEPVLLIENENDAFLESIIKTGDTIYSHAA